MAQDRFEALRVHTAHVAAVAHELEAQAMERAYVTQPSEVLKIERALSDTLALQETARDAGLADRWDALEGALQALYFNLGRRTREPETLTLGSDLIGLIETVTYAAGAAIRPDAA
jgi:hypothetical protein